VLQNFNAWTVRALLFAAGVIIFLLGFLVCADVIGRTVFNSPVKGTPEMVSMSIVIICFLLAGYSVQSGGMIYTDAVVSRFGVRGQAFALLLSAVFGILFFAIIVWGGYGLALNSVISAEYQGEGALRVPAWPARFAVLIGSVLVVLSYVIHAIGAVRVLVTGRAEDEVPVAPPDV
jgi:TRAP-type C4-dicarboxylate transport system permease small subunit